eukprot:TRINITY_DN9918_c1_g1_i1.p1 TRINITY_DN9918_c1_g1~~TRINITY_DN9918_c1_g1_i1.p1  ORF type:complete len:222 (-),score=2.82 TRINITY_DN9918_c1_g1_i1:105-770(-)
MKSCYILDVCKNNKHMQQQIICINYKIKIKFVKQKVLNFFKIQFKKFIRISCLAQYNCLTDQENYVKNKQNFHNDQVNFRMRNFDSFRFGIEKKAGNFYNNNNYPIFFTYKFIIPLKAILNNCINQFRQIKQDCQSTKFLLHLYLFYSYPCKKKKQTHHKHTSPASFTSEERHPPFIIKEQNTSSWQNIFVVHDPYYFNNNISPPKKYKQWIKNVCCTYRT